MTDEKLEILTPEEQDIECLDTFLNGLETGFTLVIYRVEPTWCKGLLEEIQVDASKTPISLQYLINTWGGHKLRLKFRRPDGKWAAHRDLSLYSFDPLKFGRPFRPNAPNPHIGLADQPIQTEQPAPAPAPPAPAPESDTRKTMELMQMMQQMRAADMSAMAALLNQRPDPPDPFQMLQSAFGIVNQLQAFRAPPPLLPSASGDNDEVLGLVGKLADMFTHSGPNNLPPARITPPIASDNQAIDEVLAKLGPQGAFTALRSAAGKMGTSDQAALMGTLIGSIEELGGTDLLLDQLERRGILGSDEGEPETDSGGESRPNARDYPPDRPGD